MGARSHVAAARERPSTGALYRMLLSGAGATLLYGGWAYVANRPFGVDAAARAAAVQGAWSFVFTLFLSTLVELSARQCARAKLPTVCAAVLPLLLVWGGPVTVHALNGTPALARTVAPGVLIGTVFVGVYLAARQRQRAGASGHRLRPEVVDIAALRRSGTGAEKQALAGRIFALWQPVFSHLDGRDQSFHLEKHVEDESAVRIRALFGLDSCGRDRALVIVRVHEHLIDGRVWARLTINAGHDSALVQSRFGQGFVSLEVWRYRLRHPLRPFFVVDSVVSEASYCVYAKFFSGFSPVESRPIPERWWPLAEAGARALGGERIPGERPEVRRFTATVRDPQPRTRISARSERAASFYRELTGARSGVGLLVVAPLSFPRYTLTFTRFLWATALRALGSRGRSA
jgi:hypothetical protein